MSFLARVFAAAAAAVGVGVVAGASPARAEADRPPATAPARQTGADRYRAAVAFFKAELVDGYKAAGVRDDRWDLDAVRFLEAMTVDFAGREVDALHRPIHVLTPQALREAGRVLVENRGCTDGRVAMAYAQLLSDDGQGRAAEAVSRIALKSGVPEVLRPRAAGVWWGVAADPATKTELFGDEARRLAEFCGKNLDSFTRRFVWRSLQFRERSVGERRELVAALDAKAGSDPWVRCMIAGTLAIDQAWVARGSGYANTVTPERWEAFYQSLSVARDELTKAWRTDPSIPHSCEHMIVVAMGGGAQLDEDEATWFARSRAAQVDYLPSYAVYLTALLPKWGGSYEAILDAGLAWAAEDPKCQTLVPWQLVTALRTINADAKTYWVSLKDPKIDAAVMRVADAYAAAHGPGKGDFYKSFRIALLTGSGRQDEARAVLDAWVAAGGTADPAAFELAELGNGRETLSQLLACTGPHAAAVAQAAAASQNNDRQTAAETLARVRAQLPPGDPQITFVDSQYNVESATLRFEDGGWVPLVRKLALRDWRSFDGGWRVDAEGRLRSKPDVAEQYAVLMENDPIRLDPAAGFDVAVRVDGQPRRGEPAVGGVAIYSATGRRLCGFAEVVCGAPTARFAFGVAVDERPIPPAAPGTTARDVLVRCVDNRLTLFVDGAQVGKPFAIPEPYRERMCVGVGGSRGRAQVIYTDLRVRKLPAGGNAGR